MLYRSGRWLLFFCPTFRRFRSTGLPPYQCILKWWDMEPLERSSIVWMNSALIFLLSLILCRMKFVMVALGIWLSDIQLKHIFIREICIFKVPIFEIMLPRNLFPPFLLLLYPFFSTPSHITLFCIFPLSTHKSHPFLFLSHFLFWPCSSRPSSTLHTSTSHFRHTFTFSPTFIIYYWLSNIFI